MITVIYEFGGFMGDVRKYEMFAQNLQQRLGIGSNFKFPEAGATGGAAGTGGSGSGNLFC